MSLAKARARTISLFNFKTSGAYDWETKFVDSTNEGDIILGIGHGTGRMTGPTTNKGEGEITFMTTSPRLSWLNGKKGRFELTAEGAPDMNEIQAKIFAL